MNQKMTNIVLIGLFMLSLVSAVYIVLHNRIPRSSTQTRFPKVFSKKYANDAIAMVYVNGPIYQGQKSQVFSGSGEPDQIIRRLRKLSKRDDVKAIVIRINSPGGSVASVQEIYNAILDIRKNKKKVIASMADVAASGGYYIAAACDKIIANPGTLTGSIGVIMELGNFQDLFKKIGVKLEVIKSGKYKDSGSPHRSMTPEEKQIFQGVINDAYYQFVRAVMDGRKMDKEKVLSLATGRIYTGNQAVQNGLIDRLGGKEDAIKLAQELAGISGEPRIIEEPESWMQLLNIIENVIPSLPLTTRDLLVRQRIRLDYMME